MIKKEYNYSLLWEKFVNEGDHESLSIIYLDHYDLLFNYGVKLTKDSFTVEDSIQNVYSYFLKIRRNLAPVNNLRGYILQCFRRQLFLDIRKQKKLYPTANMPEDSLNYFNSPEQDIMDQEKKDKVKKVIRESIKNLSAKQQEMIYLRFVFDLTYEEISEMLGISIDSCYKSVYRALQEIRLEIKRNPIEI